MQIYTLDDAEFPELLSAWKDAEIVGKFWSKGKVRIVRASSKYMLICPDNKNKKIAFRPTRSLEESIRLAKQFLKREESRGSKIEISEL